jgi:hypothetical protein
MPRDLPQPRTTLCCPRMLAHLPWTESRSIVVDEDPQAIAGTHVVVTHEVAAPHAIRKVKIPDVCIGLGVKCVTPFEMLRKEGARFVLGP